MLAVPSFRTQKRGDMVVEEIKRWIAEGRLTPGDKLPKEAALQELFGVSKGTAREALKSLEVQGLVTVSTGPAGGATISEVPLERTFQLVQNYLFFHDLNVAQIYAIRRMLEPELAAGAVAYLTDADFAALEHSIDTCAPAPASDAHARAQRQEDLHFHDVLAAANPNALLRFMCEVINHLLRHLVTVGNQPAHPAYRRLGDANVAAHRRLLEAARRRDTGEVRRVMADHIDEACALAAELDAAVRQRFVSDADLQARIVPRGRGTMTNLNRRHVLTILGAGLTIAPPAFATSLSQDMAQRLAQAQEDGKVAGLHTLLVSQGGQLVFEHYGQGDDESEGRGKLSAVVFGPDVPHDLRSVSKSVVGLAYGIALSAGKVPPPEAKLYEQFPEYSDLAGQPGRDRLTVHHALSMTLGFDWDEFTIPYGNPGNAEVDMEASPDRYRFILERPIVSEPGAKWTYCGGATALLGRLIVKGTGETLLAYCHGALFDPLGFGPVDWAKGKDDEFRAASGLRLLPRDLLKIGQLVLAGGIWNGRQVVPADWLKRALTPAVTIADGFHYGYHWYLGASPAGASERRERWVGGIGWGGQRLYVFPALDLVVAQYCGNYDKPGTEQRRINNAIITEIVLPSFV